MAENNRSSKKRVFYYETPEDYIEQQTMRANRLMFWFIAGLVLVIVFYIVSHFESPQDTFLPLEWRETDVKIFAERLFDWALWSLGGTLIYLLYEIGHNFPEIPKNVANAESGSYPASYLEYTPWYLSTLFRGPIIALVILFFFNAANLNLTGPDAGEDGALALKFSELDHFVTLLLAFILGYYSRVAKKVLDGIARKLFSRAWAEAHEDFVVEAEKEKGVLGESIVFKTTPTTDVVWATSLGTIDSTGKYNSPVGAEHCGAKALVTAVSKASPNVSRAAYVTIVPFEIVGPNEVKIGSEHRYGVSKRVEGTTWDLSPTNGAGEIGKTTGLYKAPTKQSDKKVDRFTVIATTKEIADSTGIKRECSDRMEVKIIEP